jgi:hypothetical protein
MSQNLLYMDWPCDHLNWTLPNFLILVNLTVFYTLYVSILLQQMTHNFDVLDIIKAQFSKQTAQSPISI